MAFKQLSKNKPTGKIKITLMLKINMSMFWELEVGYRSPEPIENSENVTHESQEK
jgi:hypothetical protein